MCLMVWVASTHPVTTVTLRGLREPDLVTAYHRVEEVAVDAVVRARFTLPHVSYVGSHEGCGCGFNSGALADEGFVRADDVVGLLDALGAEERAAYLAEQASRARLRAIVERALESGDVEVFGCWTGDEPLDGVGVEVVDATRFTELLAPIEERVRYQIRRV